MRKYSTILRFATGALLVSVVLLFALRAGEPHHKGRSLTSWLDQYWRAPQEEDESGRTQAQHAICAIGASKALPHLLTMLKAEDGWLRSWIARKNDYWDFRAFKTRSAEGTREFGIAGFEALGTNCASALPELTGLLEDRKLAVAAVRCLYCIGKPAEAALRQSLTNQDWQVRRVAISALAKVLDDPGEFIASVKPCLQDTQSNVRYAALSAIAHHTQAPDLVIPVLVSALQDPDERFASRAAWLLGNFATNAPGVIGTLTNAVEDPRTAVAGAALRTLVSVAPQRALPIVLSWLKSPDPARRVRAVINLRGYPGAIPEIQAALESAATDPDERVSGAAQNFRAQVDRTRRRSGKRPPSE